ncbi:MAG: hypothetical protein HWE25_00045 [Alphaproteobacteria bacterium]|nr:hypothetical protein [Alphaproteobacteria bacterium]
MATVFDELFERFGAEKAPFMHRMRHAWRDERPLDGLRIAHNIPLTLTTLLKLDCLQLAGADLTVSSYSYCPPDDTALVMLKAANIPFKPVDSMTGSYDVLMDCGAELLTRCDASLGAVELTRTGAVAYERADPAYPLVSVDNTRLKQLETCLGTGEGVYRSICNLSGRSLEGAHVVIFGFGKVGRGIAHYFGEIAGKVSIVEMLADRQESAASRGYITVSGSHKLEVEELVETADVVVTATGRASVISDYYEAEAFRQGAILANAGAEDEYGLDFDPEEILFNKGPVNFAEAEPTQMQFLDPIFYAHNMAVLDLLAKPKAGFHVLNPVVDDAVMRDWCAFHGRTEAELQAIFGN